MASYIAYKETIPIKSFLLSLLIHLIVLSSFIFVIPIMRESKKTKMIFLGQILTTNDTVKSNIFRRKTYNNIPYDMFISTNVNKNTIPYSTYVREKPSINKSLIPHKKINMKSVFDTSYKKKKKIDYKKSIEKLDNYFKKEKYYHLRLSE